MSPRLTTPTGSSTSITPCLRVPLMLLGRLNEAVAHMWQPVEAVDPVLLILTRFLEARRGRVDRRRGVAGECGRLTTAESSSLMSTTPDY